MSAVQTSKRIEVVAEWLMNTFSREIGMSSDGLTLTIHDDLSAGELAQLQAALTDGSIGQHTWGEIRSERDRLLSASDWTQNTDSPLALSQREAWATYRQALRDVPRNFTTPDAVVWPVEPTTGTPLTFGGVTVYTSLDVDAVCMSQISELILPGQPSVLQQQAQVAALSDVLGAVLLVQSPEASEEERAAAQVLIGQNLALKTALDAIWAAGMEFKIDRSL